ncbi:MAG: sulfite exporter TauE/SafE family protein [Candidimonas sp.]|nr:MAG: sulfite exporter TauE/SafE family protein [Candidimonas sp.]TAM22653.1 MAG: sulfite exporter TauE/SafE family protein [Candidimonas sp.]TAM74615.1 MAG: sulfite exporter TauE/SafE family protein [Candidimonas sp.]
MLLVSFLGALIGLVLGLTGAGGGILAVPALVVGLGFSMTAATPVALLAVGAAAIVGAMDGLAKKIVRYKAALLMAVLGSLVSHLGVRLAHIVPEKMLMTLFSMTMFLVAYRMMLKVRQASGTASSKALKQKNCVLNPGTGKLLWTRRCTITLAGIGATTGLFTGMLGVGGGFIVVPAFKRYTDIEMHSIVATSLMVIALISISTVAGILLAGAHISRTGQIFVVAAIVGMMLGRLTAAHVPAQLLQITFSILTALVSIILLAKTYFPGALA